MRCTMWILESFLSAAFICMWTVLEDLSVTATSSTTINSPRKDIGYPNPRTQHLICRRRRPSFICDPDGLLSWEQADRLDLLLENMQRTTPCLCPVCSTEKPSGVSFGIFLRENFTHEERSAVGFNSKNIAKKLREEWKLGKCENDIIIVVIAEKKKSAVSLGSTVTSVLPYKAAEQIAKDCDVHFQTNYTYYAQGLNAIVYSFHDILQQSPRRDTKSVRRKNIGIIIGISLGVIVIIILIVSGVILVWRQLKKKKSKNQNSAISWKKPQESEPYEYKFCKLEDSSTTNKADGDSSDSEEENQSDNCELGLELELQEQGMYRKRELSDVAEETEDALPANAEHNAAVLNFPLNKSRSLEVTEL